MEFESTDLINSVDNQMDSVINESMNDESMVTDQSTNNDAMNIDQEDDKEDSVNENEINDYDSLKTRRSLRNNGREAKPAEVKQDKKGTKRKSMPQSANKLKLPKYEFIPVKLETKTIYLSDITQNFILDREMLSCIPPKQGDFICGDLIWAKMQGYPWWPCMIVKDPTTGIYSKISGSSCKANHVYHVQYFGSQPYRGWTSVGMIMPFEGYEQFREKVENELKELDKKKRTKIEAKYAVKNSILKKWNESISEAEEALKLDNEERLRLLTFNYALRTNATPRNKSKNSSPKPTGSLNHSGSKKNSEDVYDFADEEDEFNRQPPGFLFRHRPPKGDYNVFLKRHFDEEAEKSPNLSKSEINKKLKEKWSELDEDMRSYYVETKANMLHESKMFVSKRSNFDDDYFNDDESDYDYESPSEHNGFGENFERKDSHPDQVNKSRRSKSKKSEKLFDKIKNEPLETPVVDDGVSELVTSTSKPKKSKETKNDLKITKNKNFEKELNNSQKKSKTGNQRKSASLKNQVSNTEVITNMCLSDESQESNESDHRNKNKYGRRFCFQCGDDELDGPILCCTGKCERQYHVKCDKDVKMIQIKDNQYICEECQMGKYKCFACKDPDDLETQKCEDSKCNKYYHLACIQNYPITVNESANTFLCPLHKCINCHLLTLDDNEYRVNNRKLVKCLRCPLAFHSGKVCIGAGALEMSKTYVICSEHYDEFNKNRHLNVNYCMACIKVGNLICCEKCPAAFHEQCLDYQFDHEKNFYCQDCLSHKQLHYDDIVWVKLGQYRWWPGRICHPNDIPSNVLKMNYKTGEFPVYFFGSHNYYWVNKGRTFVFVEGDNKAFTSNTSLKSSALKEGFAAFEEWKEKSNANNISTIANKPPPYQHIHSNRYLSGKNCYEPSEHVCDCTQQMEKPCSDYNCLNRVSLIECDPKKCLAGEKCLNQRFRKCEYVKCKPFRTMNAGWGLQTLEDIKKDQFVIEYCGEIIDEKECQKRLENIKNNFYFFTIDKDSIIDAGPKGNYARFMNHSCEPNCVTQKWMVNNLTRVGIFALEDIPAGTELTFDYNLDCRGNKQIECKCGSSKCSGFIGSRPKPENDVSNKQKSIRLTNGSKSTKNNGETNEKTSKILKEKDGNDRKQTIVHENVCFKCGEKDNLVACVQSGCTKSYHLACLNLTTLSQNQKNLICPRHVCMECNQSAFIFCSVCPNSLCKEHATMSNSLQLPDNRFLCRDHRTSEEDLIV